MRLSTAAILILSIILLTGFTTAYDGEGGADTTQISPCNNGEDDDGDGLTDGDDPGCTKPYSQDQSEENVYDLDMTWILSGGSISDSGPSVFTASSTEYTNDTTLARDQGSESGTTSLTEQYLEGSRTSWGGGDEKNTTISDDRSNIHELTNGNERLTGHPRNNQCGNGKAESGETTLNCPEDKGLPDDEENSASTITEVINEGANYNANDMSGVFTGDNYHSPQKGVYLSGSSTPSDSLSDPVSYNMDLSAAERSGDFSDDITPEGRPQDKVIPDEKWTFVPDFFLEDGSGNGVPDEIHMVYPVKVGETEIEDGVEDTDLTTTTVEDQVGTTYPSWNGDCSEDGENASCSEDSIKACSGYTKPDIEVAQLKETTNTIDTDTIKYSTYKNTGEASGHHWSEETQKGRNLEITVTNDNRDGYVTEKYLQATGCGKKPDDTCDEGNCSFTNSGSGYKKSDYTYNSGFEEDTAHYYYENVELNTVKIFDLNPVEDISNNDLVSPLRALFEGDSFDGNSYASVVNSNPTSEEDYWGYEIADDSRSLGNDPAVSVSRFHIDVNTGDSNFISVRDYFKTYDADGSNGHGDGLISVLHKRGDIQGSGTEITGDSSGTALKETVYGKGMSSTQPTDFTTIGDIPEQDCPSGFVTCIQAADVSLENLPKWSDPTNPSTGVEWNFQDNPDTSTKSYSTNESLGACELYQKLDPDDTLLESNYETDVDAPTSKSERCIGDEKNNINRPPDPPKCGPSSDLGPCEPSGDFKILMEGPAVDHEAVKEYPADYQIGAKSFNSCNFKGGQVVEGFVGNIAHEGETPRGYEKEGRSPDWEVCLNINGLETGGTGDFETGDNYDYDNDGTKEELGGEWYDLDNEKVNEYLRNSGNFLITDSDWAKPSNPNQIAYYWRSNPNPLHSTFNPSGGKSGIALEDDCGPGVNCDDERNAGEPDYKLNQDNFVYSFFLRGSTA